MKYPFGIGLKTSTKKSVIQYVKQSPQVKATPKTCGKIRLIYKVISGFLLNVLLHKILILAIIRLL